MQSATEISHFGPRHCIRQNVSVIATGQSLISAPAEALFSQYFPTILDVAPHWGSSLGVGRQREQVSGETDNPKPDTGLGQLRAAPGRPVSSRGHKARRGSTTAHRPFGKVGVHPKWDREWGQLKAQSSGGFRFPAGAARLPAPERRAGGGRPQPRGRKLRASPHQPRTHPPPPPPSPLPPAGPARSRSPCRAGPGPARSPEARRVPGGCRRRAPALHVMRPRPRALRLATATRSACSHWSRGGPHAGAPGLHNRRRVSGGGKPRASYIMPRSDGGRRSANPSRLARGQWAEGPCGGSSPSTSQVPAPLNPQRVRSLGPPEAAWQ